MRSYPLKELLFTRLDHPCKAHLDEFEQVGAGCLVGHAVVSLVIFDTDQVFWFALPARDKCGLPFVEVLVGLKRFKLG